MNIGEQYRLSWDFIRTDLRRFYKISAVVFLILMCYLTYYLNIAVSLDSIQGFLDSHAFQMKGAMQDVLLPGAEVSWIGVFVQNLLMCLVMILIGLIPVIYLPMGGVMIYGIGTGVMLGLAGKSLETGVLSLITCCFLPHGVIEFAMNLLACTCGMYLCTVSTRQLRGFNAEGVYRIAFEKVGRLFACIIIPGIAIAAILEVTVTQSLVQGLH